MKNKSPLNEIVFKNKTKDYISKCGKFKDDYYKINISNCNIDQYTHIILAKFFSEKIDKIISKINTTVESENISISI